MRLSLLMLVFAGGLFAATRSDINTIEAAENIRYLSQKIAKNYLHLYSRPKRVDIKRDLNRLVEELGKNFTVIASSTRDDSTKDLLKYLEYNQENIRNLLKKDISKEGSVQILDYSEILLEGAESIVHEHQYPFNAEETMLMNIKRYEYLVERLGKFYMASSLGPLSQSNRAKMMESRQALEKGLETIYAYRYPDDLERQKKALKMFWNSSTQVLTHAYDMFVPNLVNITGDYFEQLLKQFALYHSKSQ
jgi:hypothetical protein